MNNKKPVKTIEIIRQRVGKRSRISGAEMSSILQAICQAHGPDSLANSYVPDSFAGEHSKPWLPWCGMVRGITVVSYSERGLRDGGARYDQPGSMNPMQQAEISFVADGVQQSTLDYLRRHCERLLIVTQDPVEVFLPPGIQRRLGNAGRSGPYRTSAADAATIESLWHQRNTCPESEIDRLDDRMLKVIAPELPAEALERTREFTCGCDNGHFWITTDPHGSGVKCPQCGEIGV